MFSDFINKRLYIAEIPICLVAPIVPHIQVIPSVAHFRPALFGSFFIFRLLHIIIETGGIDYQMLDCKGCRSISIAIRLVFNIFPFSKNFLTRQIGIFPSIFFKNRLGYVGL